MSSSEIKKFYRNQTVFLTGGTGFLGYLILEKLLRVCTDLKIIYVLVRDKKRKSAEERFDDIFNCVLFKTLKSQQPGFRDKVKVIKGDCSEVGLGLSEDDRNLLKEEVNVVLHAAANVRFDQTLKNAAYNNVRPLMDLLALAKEMNDLKTFVYVSTAFSNCHQSHVKEEFYKSPMQAEKLLSLVSDLDDETLKRITPSFVDKWLNTYIFTKCVGEDLVRRQSGNLPICIVRPAIVTSTAEGPVPGWMLSPFGFGGITLALIVGALRTINVKFDAQLPFAPCDYVANTVIAAAWLTSKDQSGGDERKNGVKIYNFAGSNSNVITWRDYVVSLHKIIWNICASNMIWYPSCTLVDSTLLFQCLSFLLNIVPSYIADFVLTCIGKSPFVVKIWNKTNEMVKATERFRTTLWKFDQSNLEAMWTKMNETDRKLFNFVTDEIIFQDYFVTLILFAREHFLKDPLKTLPKAKVKFVMFFFLHYGLILFVVYCFVKLILFCIGSVLSL